MAEFLKGRYEILEVLGRGGEGRVVKALDHQHDRVVALKIRTVHGAEDRDDLLAEARVLLDLPPHPALPLVREDFFEGESYAIVMDFVDGIDLARLLSQRGQPGLAPSSVLSYLADTADALTHLHTQHPAVIHGDIKPGNLILTRGGRVKLVDFGMSSTPTARRRRGGTPEFRAPEIAGGFPASRSTDIYSLAATAFTLFTGSPPSGTLPTWERIDDINADELEAALRRGLATDPASRPPSAGELVERLQTGWATTLPTGVMTFCLSDIEASTALWDTEPEAMASALVRHDELIAEAVEARGGRFLKSMGEGDSTVSVFDSAASAMDAAIAITNAVAAEPWPGNLKLKLRIGLHTGEAERRGTDYFGPTLNLSARLRAQADGGQIFCSSTTSELVAGHLPPDHRLIDVGPHRLNGIRATERVFSLSGPAISAPFASTECPYRGLLSFEATDRQLFFGREDVVTAILDRTAPGHLLALVGASGSGKSSVLRAGVVAAALGGELPNFHRAVLVEPGVECVPPIADDDVNSLLVVDQFEELFTLCDDDVRRTRYIDALLAHPGCVVIGVRADFYGEIGSHAALARAVTDNQVLLGSMSQDELRCAVTEPARLAGLKLERGLVDVIVRDVAGEPGALPLLSHALRATWELRDGRTLTADAYREAGGVESAIARTADDIVDHMDENQRPLLRSLFLRLTNISDNANDTRRRVKVADLVPEGAARADIDTLLEPLADARLITLDADTAEMAHEALIREWPRLRSWLDEDRAGLELHRRLSDAAQLWDAGGREPADLYRGTRLDSAQEWAEHHIGELNAIERAFLDAAVALQRAEADELLARAGAQQRANRRLRFLLAAAVVALVGALVGGGIAVRQTHTAEAQRRAADTQRREADTQRREADTQRLVGQSAALLDTRRDLGLLLAVAANQRRDRLDTRGALQGALVHEPTFLGYIRQQSAQSPIAEFRANTQLVVGHDDGTITTSDIATHQMAGPVIHAFNTPLAELRVTPDGRSVLALDSVLNRVRLFDLATGIRTREFVPEQPIAAFELSHDGRLLAAGSFVDPPTQPKAFVWDVKSGALVKTLSPDPSPQTAQHNDGSNLSGVAFSSTGLLAVGSKADTISLFDERTFTKVGSLGGVPNVVGLNLAFNADGSRLASGDTRERGLMLWNVTAQRPAWPHRVDAGQFAVTITPDNNVLYSNKFGKIVTLSGSTGQPIGTPVSLQTGSVCDLNVSPDGRTLAAADCNEPTVALFSLDGRAGIGPIADTGAGLGGYSPDSNLLWTRNLTRITVHDAHTFKTLFQVRPDLPVIEFTPDGKYFLAVDGQGDAGRFDYRTNRFTGPTHRVPAQQLSTSAVDPVSGHLAIAYNDGTVIVVDADGNRVAPVGIHAGGQQIFGLSFSPDGRRLAVSAQNEQTVIYDTHTGRAVAPPIPLAANARYSPDGKLLVTAAFNGTLAFYNAIALTPNGAPITGSRAWAQSLTFSRDGRLLATVALDSTARVFDVQNREQLGAALPAGPNSYATLRPDGLALATEIDDPDGQAHTQVWSLDPTVWRAAACEEAGRNLSRAEWTKYIGGTYRAICPRWPNPD